MIKHTLTALLLLPLLLPAARAGEEKEPAKILTAADIPARIAEAEVGEWVLYRLGSGKHSRLTVIERYRSGNDTVVVIQNEVTDPKDKKKRPRRTEETVTVREAVENLRDLGSEDVVSESEILVNNRKFAAVVVTAIENGQVTRQSYFSGRIPVYGLIRGVSPHAKAKIALNLLDYGFADEE